MVDALQSINETLGGIAQQLISIENALRESEYKRGLGDLLASIEGLQQKAAEAK